MGGGPVDGSPPLHAPAPFRGPHAPHPTAYARTYSHAHVRPPSARHKRLPTTPQGISTTWPPPPPHGVMRSAIPHDGSNARISANGLQSRSRTCNMPSASFPLSNWPGTHASWSAQWTPSRPRGWMRVWRIHSEAPAVRKRGDPAAPRVAGRDASETGSSLRDTGPPATPRPGPGVVMAGPGRRRDPTAPTRTGRRLPLGRRGLGAAGAARLRQPERTRADTPWGARTRAPGPAHLPPSPGSTGKLPCPEQGCGEPTPGKLVLGAASR